MSLDVIKQRIFSSWIIKMVKIKYHFRDCSYETIDESGEIVVELLKNHKMEHEQQIYLESSTHPPEHP